MDQTGSWLGGIERALLSTDSYIAGSDLSLADICFVCELVLMMNEQAQVTQLAGIERPPMTGTTLTDDFPQATAHFDSLCAQPAFAADIAPYLDKLARAAA